MSRIGLGQTRRWKNMPPAILLVLTWLGAYLVGAIPFGYLVARSRGVDIFKTGSGNLGATNVGRVLGKKLGILVFLLDAAKGALPVAAALSLRAEMPQDFAPGWLEVGSGLAAFLGHLYPVFFGFEGGKGVATSLGVILGLSPWVALAALATWLFMALVVRISSLSALTAAVLAPVYGWWFGLPRVYQGALWFVVVLLIWRHRSNIHNLLASAEDKIGADDGP